MSRWSGPLLALALCACAPPEPPGPPGPSLTLLQQYRLQESFRYRSAIAEAVALANTILGRGAPVRLYPSWRGGEAGFHPVYEKNGTISLTLAVPVYPVDSDNLSPDHFIFVPPRGRCVFVNVDRLPDFFRLFSPTTRIEGLPVDEPRALAFALMHEAGHIFHGDAGSFDDAHPLELRDMLAVQLTLEDIKAGRTASLNPELRADLFALKHLKEAQSDSASQDRSVDAMFVQGIFGATTFNFIGKRVVENPGEQGSARRARFRDASYSHPNLELRMRVLAYLSTPDAQTEEGLRSFLEERNAPRKPGLVFIAPGISPNQLQQLSLPQGSASDAH